MAYPYMGLPERHSNVVLSTPAMKYFLSADKYAVVGRTLSDTSRFDNRTLRWYIQHGLPVIPVKPNAAPMEVVEGLGVLSDSRQIPDLPNTSLSIVLHPDLAYPLLQSLFPEKPDPHSSASSRGQPRAIWFQPGADDQRIWDWIRARGIEDRAIVRGGCLLRDGEGVLNLLHLERTQRGMEMNEQHGAGIPGRAGEAGGTKGVARADGANQGMELGQMGGRGSIGSISSVSAGLSAPLTGTSAGMYAGTGISTGTSTGTGTGTGQPQNRARPGPRPGAATSFTTTTGGSFASTSSGSGTTSSVTGARPRAGSGSGTTNASYSAKSASRALPAPAPAPAPVKNPAATLSGPFTTQPQILPRERGDLSQPLPLPLPQQLSEPFYLSPNQPQTQFQPQQLDWTQGGYTVQPSSVTAALPRAPAAAAVGAAGAAGTGGAGPSAPFLPSPFVSPHTQPQSQQTEDASHQAWLWHQHQMQSPPYPPPQAAEETHTHTAYNPTQPIRGFDGTFATNTNNHHKPQTQTQAQAQAQPFAPYSYSLSPHQAQPQQLQLQLQQYGQQDQPFFPLSMSGKTISTFPPRSMNHVQPSQPLQQQQQQQANGPQWVQTKEYGFSHTNGHGS